MPVYLKKPDMLAALHTSKKSYCSYVDPARHSDFHAIVQTTAEITPELIAAIVAAKAVGTRKEPPVILDPAAVVIRAMVNDHVPDDPERKRKARKGDRPFVAATPFPAFKHFCLVDGQLVEVGRSHWKGTIDDGHYSIDHGRISDELAKMFMLLVSRIGTKSNFRGYSFVAEMEATALMQLCQTGLQFDESRSDNPFAFYTTAINHCFVRIINTERRQREIRDEILCANGLLTSHAFQDKWRESQRQ